VKPIVIIGAGGHGREVADIIRHQAQHGNAAPLLGFIDDRAELHGQVLDGAPVLGDWSWFDDVQRDDVAVICALGTPATFRRVVQRVRELGFFFARAISPLAYISPTASLGQGVMVFPHAFISTGAWIDDHCIINTGTTVSHDSKIGSYCNVNPGVHLAGNVTIGEGCYIGMGTNVIQGHSIGPWAVIGAGAGVICDIPAHATAVGIPAKVIKQRKEA
jgi:sugar O-acyltransferase (sialic acid O-acetyltransferase NeuD family)